MRRVSLAALLATATWLAASPTAEAQARQGSDTGAVLSRVRFDGSVLVGTPGRQDSVHVEIRVWTFAGGQRNYPLDLPFRGSVVAELRAGRLTTIIGAERIARSEGDVWSIPPDSTMLLEIGDDMATLETTVIEER